MTKVFSLHSGMFAMCDINMRDLNGWRCLKTLVKVFNFVILQKTIFKSCSLWTVVIIKATPTAVASSQACLLN